MNVKKILLNTFLLLSPTIGWSAPGQQYAPAQQRSQVGDDLATNLRQIKNALSDLQHEMRNHENEIKIFDNKVQSQESAFEHFRQQLSDEVQSQKDYTRATAVNLEGKIETLNHSIDNLEMLLRGLTNDFRQIKTQSNDSVNVLGQYRQKIAELEGLLQAQNHHMESLELALQSMMEVWQAKEAAREVATKALEVPKVIYTESGKIYKVQSGDSLEKIARSQKVSLQALREINNLSSDKILIGQTLKIPE